MSFIRSGFVQVNFNGPEWQVIKEMLNDEMDLCVKNLLKSGGTESEYNQWRGRAALITKLLDLEKGPPAITD